MIKIYSDFFKIKDLWKEKQNQLKLSLPFSTWEWQNIWWQNGGQGELVNIAVYNNQKYLGVGSFRIENKIVKWSANEEITDYQDILGEKENNLLIWQEILSYFKSPRIKSLELRNLPQESETRSSLKKISIEKKYQYEEKIEDVVPFISLPQNFNVYLESLSRKNRHELKRKIHRFEKKSGYDYQLVKSKELDHQKDCEHFFKLFKSGNPEKREFLTPVMEKFFCQATFAMRDLNLLDFSSLIYKNEIISQTISFVNKKNILLYNMASNINYYHLSPGLMINKLLIEESIQKKRKIYDFLQGNERYKYQLGAKDNFVYQVTVKL